MLNYTVLAAVAYALVVQHSVSQNVVLTTLINQEIQISTLTSTANWNVNFGAATDIAIGADGTLWSIGIDSDAGGNRIYKWIPTQRVWKYMFGSASKIAVNPVGSAYVITQQNQIFQWTSSGWDQVPGTLTDIAIGPEGSIWGLGTSLGTDGYGVYKWDDWNQTWVSVGGAGMTIAVDPEGYPYVITRQNRVQRWNGLVWNEFEGSARAREIGIGADGTIYIIGTNAVFGGYAVFKWDLSNNYWIGIPIGAVKVAVDPNGNPRFVNSFKQVIQFQPEVLIPCNYGTWELLPGLATDIGIGSDGSTWIIGGNATTQGTGYQVLRWVPGTKDWTRYPDPVGGGQRITVDRTGNAWIVDFQNRVQRWTGIRWDILPGVAVDISAGSNGSVWIIGRNQEEINTGFYKWIPEREVWQDNAMLGPQGPVQISGYANRIAVDPNDDPWILTDSGNVYRGTIQNGWTQLYSGNAKDIGIGADGSAYIIGTDPALGGYEIFRWNEDIQSWVQLPGENGASQVAVDKNGNPYLVDQFGQILRPNC